MPLSKVINFNSMKEKKLSEMPNSEDDMLQYMKNLFDSNLKELQFKKEENKNGNSKSKK